jgi:hypothetical protein
MLCIGLNIDMSIYIVRVLALLLEGIEYKYGEQTSQGYC